MKVKELIKLLQEQDQDRIVVLATDQEGNKFSTLVDISTQTYDLENCEIGIEVLTEELISMGYSKNDIIDGESALVLWP